MSHRRRKGMAAAIVAPLQQFMGRERSAGVVLAVSVAVAMLARQMDWQDWGDESMEFCRYVNDMEPEARAAYFAE